MATAKKGGAKKKAAAKKGGAKKGAKKRQYIAATQNGGSLCENAGMGDHPLFLSARLFFPHLS